jgi:hypothetical protein
VRAAVAAVLLAAAFAAVAALNAVGSFDGIDAYAVHHLMPGLDPAHSSEPSLVDAVLPFSGGGGAGERAAEVWLYPASAPVSALIVALACLALWRRTRRRAALVWGTTFVAAVAVEVRPAEIRGDELSGLAARALDGDRLSAAARPLDARQARHRY